MGTSGGGFGRGKSSEGEASVLSGGSSDVSGMNSAGSQPRAMRSDSILEIWRLRKSRKSFVGWVRGDLIVAQARTEGVGAG